MLNFCIFFSCIEDSTVPGFQASIPRIAEIQEMGLQRELGIAMERAYGLNKFACIFLFSTFIIGLDNMNYKMLLVCLTNSLRFCLIILFGTFKLCLCVFAMSFV